MTGLSPNGHARSPRSSPASSVRPQQVMDDPAGFRRLGQCAVIAVAMAAPIIGIGAFVLSAQVREQEQKAAAFVRAAGRWEDMVAAPAGAMLPAEEASRGRALFRAACAACHGVDGSGGLGKNLSQSDFVAGLGDDALREFIRVGRPNAKPLPMPAKGGREDLTDGNIAEIAVYIRGLQDPRRMPVLTEVASAPAAAPSADEKAAALAAAGGDEELAEYIASGRTLYSGSCLACHGPGGSGIKGNGKALAKNSFIGGQDDDALLAFIKKGRDPSDPKNTTGVGMPAKGGNPALSDDDLLDIIAYLRSLQDKQAAAK
ncbi:MAG TPA: c-type cytochrome [Phycisphaerales bacterium]|nr:c-type cytochrome [Phycisphaerales bacterium]